ncbi:hypothetical protein CVV68_06115 [Arthrobacter livingstonensis]|uniref:Transglutaminase-like domain-containing protein n=1 Tax=Arthrobacter livingstonensis TaxID=670078 RepID=A0A2V5LA00_9MICC|nr:DUF3488 and transglutaminase-like domain-containing protein [Arthrobacter livingstonensis]PYI68385.1 hypothetical protein CVV68_06115 [Arthrobacter livingstonensis]
MTGTVAGTHPPHGTHDGGRPGSGPGGGRERGWRSAVHSFLGRPETGPARWVLAVAVLGAVMGTSLGFRNVMLDFSWLPKAFLVAALTVLLPALVRRYPRLAAYAPIAALLGWFMGLTLAFFPGTAYLGVIPSTRTVGAAVDLATEASATIMVNNTPVPPDTGLVFVICAGVGFAALLVDTLAVTVAMPAAAAAGLVLLLLPGSLTTQDGIGTSGFIGAGAGYLLLLGCCRWYAPDGKLRPAANRASSGTLTRATVLGTAVVLVAMVLPAAIPGFDQGSFPQGSRLGSPGNVAGLDPMISLGNDLRAQSGAVNLTYLSNSDVPLYVRMSTLEDFSGKTWKPSAVPKGLSPVLSGLLPKFGPNPAVPVVQTKTWVDVVNLSSTWLPAPLSTTEVVDLRGEWTWNPSTQTINADGSSTRSQSYMVTSEMPVLTPALLEAATQKPDAGLDPVFTALPNNVPSIIKKTAEEVTKGKSTPYDRAMAIQDYLRSSVFSYSEKTPVDKGYDGAGMNVLAKFLEVKAGYCVHFSATMAVMARELGIPSRIAVGYAPGDRTTETAVVDGQSLQGYQVAGRDAHAWPELYFEGLGWVPFEPTPSRGAVPSYARDDTSNTSNPGRNDFLNGANANPTAAAAPTAVATASGTAAAAAPVAPTPRPARISATLVGVLLVLLALASPAFTRIQVRRRRLALVRGSGRRGTGSRGAGGRGSAADPRDAPELLAWREFIDAAVDHGYNHDPSLTPSMQAAGIARLAGLDPSDSGGGAASGPRVLTLTAADVLRNAYENAVYGPPAAATGGTGRDDLADALEDVGGRLKSRADAWTQVRAVLLPPSLFRKTR